MWVPIEPKATMWDRQVAGIERASKIVSKVPILVVDDLRVHLQAIKMAGTREKECTRGLKEVVCLIWEIVHMSRDELVSMGWVKAHIRINSNEKADTEVNYGVRDGRGRAVTKGRISVCMKEMRNNQRVIWG